MEKDSSAGNLPPGGHHAPGSNRDFDFFYAGLEQGQLLVQKCLGCGTLRNPPSPSCAECGSFDWAAQPLSGRGSVYSFIIHHYPALPTYETPHPVVLAELDDGVRFLAAMDGTPPEAISIGMRVEAEFLRRNNVASIRFKREA